MSGFRRLALALPLLSLIALDGVAAPRCADILFPQLTDITKREWTMHSEVKQEGDTVLIVGHPSQEWDKKRESEPGLTRLIRSVRARGIERIYLLFSLRDEGHLIRDANPTYLVASSEGDFSFRFKARHVIVAGGNCFSCSLKTMGSIFDQAHRWRKSGQFDRDLRISIFTDAVYDRNGVLKDETNFDPTFSYHLLSHALREKMSRGEQDKIVELLQNHVESSITWAPHRFKRESRPDIEIQLDHVRVDTIDGLHSKRLLRRKQPTERPKIIIDYLVDEFPLY